MSEKYKTLFPDTNYFLHYPPLDQVDWLETAGAESVLICVCMQVIHELDTKTYDPRLKDRAKRVIKELRNIRKNGSTVQPKVTLEIPSEDTRDEFFRPGLNPRNNDDRILQCVLHRKETFPLEEIEVVSDDFGMELKCENLNIKILKPDPTKKLPDLADAQLKQLRDAQNELEKYKNALPSLSLSFKDGGQSSSSHFKFRLPSSSPIDINAEMEGIRNKYPFRSAIDEASTVGLLAMQPLGTISKQEYDRYNAELEEFYSGYENHLKVCELMRQANERLFRAAFILKNDGYSPAHQIDIHIHFPDGMNILDADNLPPGFKERKPPEPPKEPRTAIDKIFSLGHLQSFAVDPPYFPHIPNLSREEPNVSPPTITKTSSYDIHFDVKKLKHGYSLELGNLLILFPSKDEAKSFSVDYRITADNHPQNQDGQLHFLQI